MKYYIVGKVGNFFLWRNHKYKYLLTSSEEHPESQQTPARLNDLLVENNLSEDSIEYFYNDNIDPELFNEAYKTSRKYPGMGGLTIKSHPYEGVWIVTIDFGDGQVFIGEHPDINKAINNVIQLTNEQYYYHP